MIVVTEAEQSASKARRQQFHSCYAALAAFFFLLMLVLPTTFQLQRSVLLAGLVAGAVAAISRWRVSGAILFFLILTLVVGGFSILRGYINGAPGALRVSTVYILWPIIYMLFVGLVHCPGTIVLLEKTLVLGVAVSALMAIALLIGAVLGHASEVCDIFAFQAANIVLYDGYVELTLRNLSTVIYGLPFLTALFFSPFEQRWWQSRAEAGCVLLLVLIVCAVSGRRAFWLLAFVTPGLVWGLFFLAGGRCKGKYEAAAIVFALAVAIGGTAWLLGLDFGVLSERFRSAFDFSGEQSASLRYQQLVALMSEWSDSPLIGQGLGASAESIIRSEKMSWAYELSYVALLFQSGLFGVIIFSVAILWVFYMGIKIVRMRPDAAQLILPLLAGLAGFLLVNATNPYLSKFDYLWTIFLPVAAINAYMTEKWL